MNNRASRSSALVAILGLLGSALVPAPVLAQADTPKAASPPWLTRDELRAKYADPASRMMRIGGVEVHYKDEGTGPAVLLIHGSVSTLKTWDGVADDLKKNYRVIRYDIPPFGLSSSVSDDVASSLKPVEVAEQLLQSLGVQTVTVVGVSSGGTAGVQLAARRPDLVARLILSNAPSDPLPTGPIDPSTLSPEYSAAMREEKRLGYRTLSFWNAWFGHYSPNFRASPAFLEHIYDMNRRVPEANLIALIAKVADAEAAMQAMNGVKAPTLLLWGGADPMLPAQAMDTLGSYLTQARVSKLLMPDVGHYPPMEVPQRYANLVRAYIENVVPVAD